LLDCSTIERYKFKQNIMKDRQDNLNILLKLSKNPKATQRKLAQELGLSLGKLNYCLKALKNKGLIKINNFKNNPNKINYMYILTPKGIKEKSKLTFDFMKRKLKEYEDLKNQIEE